MTRSQLEHIIRAAGTIADDTDIVVIGSQAILGQFPDAPPNLLVSMEADVYPRNKPERSDLIDASIGEGSPFERTFGYYGYGVGPETAILPSGWEERLVLVESSNTLGIRGWCLEVHDLTISKLAAGRDKDLEFAAVAAGAGMADTHILRARLARTPLRPELEKAVVGRVSRLERGG
ncbi:MAG: DUF6036 family nucleotidyltransferase [Bryobacteraceae bacterium]|nr:DUF6036 family nucleotidyltransferase [Bryobacteraceae bacterium]